MMHRDAVVEPEYVTLFASCFDGVEQGPWPHWAMSKNCLTLCCSLDRKYDYLFESASRWIKRLAPVVPVAERTLYLESSRLYQVLLPLEQEPLGHLQEQLKQEAACYLHLIEGKKDAIVSLQRNAQGYVDLIGGLRLDDEDMRLTSTQLCHRIERVFPQEKIILRVLENVQEEGLCLFCVQLSERVKIKEDTERHLLREIKAGVVRLLPAISSPPNEEETLRSWLFLSEQLNRPQDPPHLLVSFLGQTADALEFCVLIVRFVKQGQSPLLLSLKEGTTLLHETRYFGGVQGRGKQKWVKEATRVVMQLPKGPFCRPDFTIDLLRARCKLIAGIDDLVPGIRDLNGGILLKQQENLEDIKRFMGSEEEWVDQLFYAITPGVRQAWLPPLLLREFFTLCKQTIDRVLDDEGLFENSKVVDAALCLCIAGTDPAEVKKRDEEIGSFLVASGGTMSVLRTQLYGISCVGYLYSTIDSDMIRLLNRLKRVAT